MPPKPKQGAAPNATPSAPPKQRSKPLSAWSPRRHRAVTSGSIMPTEQLTYAQIAERLSVSPEAARAIVKRHRLPRSRRNDGKTLAAIDLKEIRHTPMPVRSPRARRPTGHHARPHGRRVGSPPLTPTLTPRSRTAGCLAGHLPDPGHGAT